MIVSRLAGLIGLAALIATPVLAQEGRSSESGPVPPAQILTIDQQGVVGAADATKKAVEKISAALKPSGDKVRSMMEEGQKKISDFQQKANLLSDEKKQQIQVELQQLEQQIQTERQVAQVRFELARQDLVKQVWTEASTIAIEIMKARGANMLLERRSVHLISDSEDISQAVVNRLNASGKQFDIKIPTRAEAEKMIAERRQEMEANVQN